MYQAIYFDRDKKSNTLYHYYLRDDKKGIKCFQYWPTVYKINPEGEFQTLFGDRCSPITGKYDREDPTILEKDIDRELVLLRDLYYNTDDIPSYHNIVYLDIEIEILGALTPATIKEAEAEITSIALIDDNTKEKICFILDKNNQLEQTNIDGKVIIPCPTEKKLINEFLNKWEQIDPTIVVSWNGDFFDIPYLYFRIQKLLGDEVLRLSPIKKIDVNLYNGDSPIKIGLVNSLDYMLLLKKYITKEESSYKLGEIGLKYVNLGKIEYNGNLDKLFKEDPIKFIEYNIRDVEIIEALESKQKFIELTILISHLCHTPYESIYYNTSLNEGAILTYLKRKNIVAPNKPTTTNPSIREMEEGDTIVHQRGTPTIEGILYSFEDSKTAIVKTSSGKYMRRNIRTIRKKEGYAGGYLLEVEPNLYDWVVDSDYSSLYPSIIRSLNLSIETLVGRIKAPNQNYNTEYSLEELKKKNPDEILTLEKLNKKTYKIIEGTSTVENLIDIIESNNLIISANGTIFDPSKRSIVAEILTDWFNLRTEYKNIMKKAYKSGDIKKGDLYNQKQHSIKILLNSVYGTFAINSWRFTDGYKMLSSSITTTGQRFIIETLKHANEIIEKKYL
jgi:DNA polymerase elongation subunit (family B)